MSWFQLGCRPALVKCSYTNHQLYVMEVMDRQRIITHTHNIYIDDEEFKEQIDEGKEYINDFIVKLISLNVGMKEVENGIEQS